MIRVDEDVVATLDALVSADVRRGYAATRAGLARKYLRQALRPHLLRRQKQTTRAAG